MRLGVIGETLGYVAACAICYDRAGRILLGLSTANDDRNNMWCFPGGGIEPGEHPSRAAERECFEETGYRVFAISRPQKYRHKPQVAFVVCRSGGGAPLPNSEFSELRWFTKEEALQLPDLYPANQQILVNL